MHHVANIWLVDTHTKAYGAGQVSIRRETLNVETKSNNDSRYGRTDDFDFPLEPGELHPLTVALVHTGEMKQDVNHNNISNQSE